MRTSLQAAVVGGIPVTTSVIDGRVGCWSLPSWQQLRPYQDEFRLVIVRTRGDFGVLLHGETRLPSPHILLSHIIVELNQPVVALF